MCKPEMSPLQTDNHYDKSIFDFFFTAIGEHEHQTHKFACLIYRISYNRFCLIFYILNHYIYSNEWNI